MASLASTPPLTRDSVIAAHVLIKPFTYLTPVQTNTTLSHLASTPQTPDALKGTLWEGKQPAEPRIRLWFKCENFQRIGAFKVRGAFHAVRRLMGEVGEEEVVRRGVVTHSSGMVSIPSSRLFLYRLVYPPSRLQDHLLISTHHVSQN
jgi:threonine dehydratase